MRGRPRVALIGPLLLALLGLGWVAWRRPSRPSSESHITTRPIRVDGNGYLTSDACRGCHPREHDTWHASYHRTMTTVATPDALRAPADGRPISAGDNGTFRVMRKGDGLFVELEDPDHLEPGRVTRRVALMTGSHHQQILWYETGRGRLLGQFPLTYLIAEQRWVPRSAAFLQRPVPVVVSETGHWNQVCISCHTTSGRARVSSMLSAPRDGLRADSHVAEFGIACDACHGPSEAHVRTNASVLRRIGRRLTGTSDEAIVHPARIDPRRSALVCGQCHSVWEWRDPESERRENAQGPTYRPGGELDGSRVIARPSRDRTSTRMRELLEADPHFLSDSFWPDGEVSVSGRELNGLIDSPCYEHARDPRRMLTCLSCHEMHQAEQDGRPRAAWADDQLAAGKEGDEACLQCHDGVRADVRAHTHHAPRSSGSRCYNCHMPNTTYGLLKAIRSHRISSPDVRVTLDTGRPDACSLCHLDKPLGWTADRLQAWYGTTRPHLAPDQETTPAAVGWLIAGDAQQRALAAHSFGWAPAQQASGAAWMVPLLASLLEDPYPAVRTIATRALATMPAAGPQAVDVLGTAAARADASQAITRAWASRVTPAEASAARALIARLSARRNDRRVFLRE